MSDYIPLEKITKGYVYFVLQNGLIKIGIAHRLLTRFQSLQNQFGKDIVLINAIYVPDRGTMEHDLHEEFRGIRVRGEWFRDSPELRAKIRLLAKTYPARISKGIVREG